MYIRKEVLIFFSCYDVAIFLYIHIYENKQKNVSFSLLFTSIVETAGMIDKQ